MSYRLLFFLLLISWKGIAQEAPGLVSTKQGHGLWTELLKKNVSKDGKVNYKGFQADSLGLNSYLQYLSENPPSKSASKAEKTAFWINAYNAFTVKLITKHYPIKSIKDIKRGIPFVNTVWDIKFIKIGGETYDLNNIEHSILRKKLFDPRLHFALNCASTSCPKLLNEAFEVSTLEQQLQRVTKDFIQDASKNEISSTTPKLSMIFSWYKGDFTKKTSLIAFVNQYSTTKIAPNANLSFKEYDWSLNE